MANRALVLGSGPGTKIQPAATGSKRAEPKSPLNAQIRGLNFLYSRRLLMMVQTAGIRLAHRLAYVAYLCAALIAVDFVLHFDARDFAKRGEQVHGHAKFIAATP